MDGLTDNRHNFLIDRPYARADDQSARYLIGSAAVGAPWEVTIPTNLVVLFDQLDKLNSQAGVNVIDAANVLVGAAGGG